MSSSARNILFILTDQHRADALGCYGNTICRTPSLDLLASRGTTFDRSYTVCSLCSPARGTLMSGQYPHTFGLLNNVEAPGSDMKEIERRPYMNPEVLRREGFNLGYVGKWHLGDRVLPSDFGFQGDNFPGHGGGGMDYPEFHDYLKARGLQNPYPERSERRSYFSGLMPGPEEGTVPYFLGENTNALLERYAGDWKEDGKPFFLWCNFWGPHHPCFATEEFMEMYRDADIPPWPNFEDSLENKPLYQRYQRWESDRDRPWEDRWQEGVRNYYAFCTLIDRQIGRILDRLAELGLDEDTLVIFSSDHGDSIGFHGGLSDKAGFTYEENYRVPLIIRDPALPASHGTRHDGLVSMIDYVPTWLDAVGIDAPDEMQGTSLMPILRGEDVERREQVFAEYHGFVVLHTIRMIRTERDKYVYNGTDLDEYYDLVTDPHELDNRIADPACRERVHELMGRLTDWSQETRDIAGRKVAIKRSYYAPESQ